MIDNCDMNLFDPENMEIKPGNINLFIPEGSKMTVSASVDSLYCIGLRVSDRDIDLNMSKEQAVKLARGILTLSGEERRQGEWVVDNWGMYHCNYCMKEKQQLFNNFCSNCGADMRGKEE